MGLSATERDLLDRVLAAVAVADLRWDEEPLRRTLSLVGPQPRRSRLGLWAGDHEVARPASVEQLVRAAAAWVAGWEAPPDGVVVLDAVAAVGRDGRALLLPGAARVGSLAARLRPLGLVPVDAPLVHLRPSDGRVLVGGGPVPLPPAVGSVADGAYEVAAVVVAPGHERVDGAARVARLTRLVAPPWRPEEALAALAAVASNAAVVEAPEADLASLVATAATVCAP